MTKFRCASFYALVLGSLLATSCTKPEISKAEYIEKIDALCKNAVKEIVGNMQAPGSDLEKVSASMDRVLAAQNKMFSDIEKVARPTQDAQALDEFFSAGRLAQEGNAKLMEHVKRNLKVLSDPNNPDFPKARQELSPVQNEAFTAIQKMSSAALKYGFKECGRGLAAPPR